MYTIEFETVIRNGIVKIPEEYMRLKNSHVKIVVIVNEKKLIKDNSVNLNFSDCDITVFANEDAVKLQREMRDEW